MLCADHIHISDFLMFIVCFFLKIHLKIKSRHKTKNVYIRSDFYKTLLF